MAVLWHEPSNTDDVPLLESISQSAPKVACSALKLIYLEFLLLTTLTHMRRENLLTPEILGERSVGCLPTLLYSQKCISLGIKNWKPWREADGRERKNGRQQKSHSHFTMWSKVKPLSWFTCPSSPPSRLLFKPWLCE